MAYSLALNKLVSSNLLSKSLGGATRLQAIPASRLFHQAFIEYDSENNYYGGHKIDVRPYTKQAMPYSRSDSFFSTKTSLSERLKMMDEFMDSQYQHVTTSTYRGILPGHWEARETDDGFYIRMYMPGLAKEKVYITGEHNYMIIGEVSSNGGRAWRISTTIDLPLKFYKSDQIKAEMKNGVLNIVVLKSDKEERGEEFHVNVE